MPKFYTVSEFEAVVRERVKPMPTLMKKAKPGTAWTQIERLSWRRECEKMYHEWRAAKARFQAFKKSA